MKVGIAQIDCHVGDVAANERTLAAMLEQGRESGCDLVVFPEMADAGCDRASVAACAAPLTEGACPRLKAWAGATGVAVLCGLAERDGDRIFSTLVAIDGQGTLVATYRKTHLFSTESVREDEYLTRGDSLVLTRLGGFSIGLMLCYDLRFPEVARALALGGADVLVVAAAWPLGRIENWLTLSTARAIENQVYVLASNRVGTDGDGALCGESRLIDPFGTTLSCASGTDETLIVGDVLHEPLAKCRAGMPAFAERQVGLYGRITGYAMPDGPECA